MHSSAYEFGKRFFQTYTQDLKNFSVVEIGSQNVNGALRDHKPQNCQDYIGLDFVNGNGVDVVLQDAYKFPFPANTFDVLVTSSCFEHSEMFWLSFLEGMRVLKPHGIMYCNAPSSWMMYHRYPVDCWRFYPDAAKGLQSWGKYNGMNVAVLESFIVKPWEDLDNCDWAAVFIKDEAYMENYKSRMIDSLVDYEDYFNGFRFPANDRFPDGWSKPKAEYHQATKKNLVFSYAQGIVY
jgi:predicted SAM-dependent methyltransferase